jgi:hypothetical protein
LEFFKEGLGIVPEVIRKKMVDSVKTLLVHLLTSGENTDRQGGLKLFGCLLGLRVNGSNVTQYANMIAQNALYVKSLIDLIFESTYDWNSTSAQIA